MKIKPSYSTIENRIFWNAYAQECSFVGKKTYPPMTIGTTCNKLAQVYQDLDTAEMFIRAQFVMNVPSALRLSTIVMGFKDFVGEKYHTAYREYAQQHKNFAFDLLQQAEAVKDTYLDIEFPPWRRSKLPLGIYLARGSTTSLKVQEQVAICCLRHPYLTTLITVSDPIKEMIRYHKIVIR